MSAIDAFIEEMGLMAQEHGDPRILGRVLGLLVAEGKEMSLSQMSERLGVSRASVSTNARQLSQRGLIKRIAHSGDRQDFYHVENMLHRQLLDRMATQAQRNASRIRACAKGIEVEDAAAAERVLELHKLYEKSAEILAYWASEARDDAMPRKEPT